MASPMMTRDAMQQLSTRILAMNTADEMRVNITSGASGNTRFAAGDITTSGDVEDTVISITSTVGGRRASSTTNLMDDASLKRAVETAERLARLSPVDPELVPELGPQQYQTINANNADVSNLDAGARAQAVEQLIAAARAPGGAMPIDPASLFVAGFLDASSAARGIATSKGLFAYHASTDVSLSCTARTPDGTGSGYAAAGGRAWTTVDPAGLGRRAAQKALASRNPVAIEPGRYTVILEPRAVADFVPFPKRAVVPGSARRSPTSASHFSPIHSIPICSASLSTTMGYPSSVSSGSRTVCSEISRTRASGQLRKVSSPTVVVVAAASAGTPRASS
jgi:predicted Zn-dependent protease